MLKVLSALGVLQSQGQREGRCYQIQSAAGLRRAGRALGAGGDITQVRATCKPPPLSDACHLWPRLSRRGPYKVGA